MMTRSQTAWPTVTGVPARCFFRKNRLRNGQHCDQRNTHSVARPQPVFVTESGAQVADFKIEYSE
jgi:hypothetical protein